MAHFFVSFGTYFNGFLGLFFSLIWEAYYKKLDYTKKIDKFVAIF